MKVDCLKIFKNALNGQEKALEEMTTIVNRGLDKDTLKTLLDYWQSLDKPEDLLARSHYLFLSGLLCGCHVDLIAQSIDFHQQAIKLNNPMSMNKLGLFYLNGVGGKINYKEAINLFDKAIALNYHRAMVNRAIMFTKEGAQPKDFKTAFSLLDKAIKLKYPGAMLERAKMHAKGIGSPKNLTAAIDLLNKAMDLNEAMNLNFAGAINYRACLYMDEDARDFNLAKPLFEQAIALNFTDAMYNLGVIYESGRGTPRNYATAILYYDMAIKQYSRNAMYKRALMHAKGRGGEVDLEAAFHLLLNAYFVCKLYNDEKFQQKIKNQLHKICEKLPHFFTFKAKTFIPDFPMRSITATFSQLFGRLNHEKLLEKLVNDQEPILPEKKQIEYCAFLYAKNPKIISIQEQKARELLGKTLAFLARHKFLKREADNLYNQVPKDTAARADACFHLAQRIYFENKKKVTPAKAYELAKPYLDEAVAAEDKSAMLFLQSIESEISGSPRTISPLNLDTTQHLKIFFSKNTLNIFNELMLIRHRTQNPQHKICLLIEKSILSNIANQKIQKFCAHYDIELCDFSTIEPELTTETEQRLFAKAKQELEAVNGRFEIAKEITKWLRPVIKRGIYSDFSVEINFQMLPEQIAVNGFLLPLTILEKSSNLERKQEQQDEHAAENKNPEVLNIKCNDGFLAIPDIEHRVVEKMQQKLLKKYVEPNVISEAGEPKTTDSLLEETLKEIYKDAALLGAKSLETSLLTDGVRLKPPAAIEKIKEVESRQFIEKAVLALQFFWRSKHSSSKLEEISSMTSQPSAKNCQFQS